MARVSNGRGGKCVMTATTVALTCSLLAGTLAAQQKPNDKNKKAPPPPRYASDADVVASMKKGIDYLLANKNAQGNWETGRNWPKAGQKGGETALVLYALMHAGQSLQDDLEYQQKLSWRNKETIGPAVDWLIQQTPEETYTAGMMANALTLLPKRKDEKPGEGVRGALERCRDFLMLAMGGDGGYGYAAVGGNEANSIESLWNKYVDALINANRPGGNAKDEGEKVKKAKEELDKAVRSLRASFGGAELAMQNLLTSLRAKQAAAEAAKDAAAANRARAEIQELNKYWASAPKTGGRNVVEELKKAQEQLANARGQRLGVAMKNIKEKPAGGGKEIERQVPKTKEDLEKEVKEAQARVDTLTIQARNDFAPIGDLSNAQYGALGAWALADWGMEIRTDYWEVTDRFWRLLQRPDGAWTYNASPGTGGETTHTMGVAGIATLYVTTEFTDDKPPVLLPRADQHIERGLAWLNKDFTAKKRGHFYYYMYGVERVGLSTGLKFFGTTDWYRDGSTEIIRNQKKEDGSWDGEYNQNVSTSYALLFLSRGRNPIVFNKLQYDGPWNARPRDNAYITRWMAKEYEKPINWQIVNLKVDAEQWLDAPILLITGSQDPKFKPEDIAKLRAFINAGGMIFSTADGGQAAFTTAMQKYASDVVDKKYEMRPLPNNHMLFSNELLQADMKNPPQMLGMSNGLREIWVHSTVDMGASWHARRYAQKDHFLIPSALFFYATGKGSLRGKLAPLAVDTTRAEPARTMNLARIDHVGNADPEPGAWPRFAKVALVDFKTDVKLQTMKFTDLDAKKTPIAHMTGSTGFPTEERDVEAVRKYLKDGGLLFIDTAGGSGQFASAAANFVRSVYPDNALQPLSEEHPIISGKMPDGADCRIVQWRKFARLKLNNLNQPRLEGVKDGNRWTIIYSAHDITSGLLGTNTWGIVGYTDEWSEKLAANVVLFTHFQNNPPAATTAPATQTKTAAK